MARRADLNRLAGAANCLALADNDGARIRAQIGRMQVLLDASWWLRHGETLQHAAFFSLLPLLAMAERWWPRHAASPNRRRRWPANAAITALNVLTLALMPISLVTAASLAEAAGLGLLCLLEVPTGAAFALSIAARSLLSYATHRLMHRLPWLWRIHRVHHLDTHLDVSTTVRFHPLEFVVQMVIALPVVVLLGLSPLALLVYEVADVIVNLWSHANVRWPTAVERVLRHVIVTPSLHRVHHSARRDEADSNYGAVLPQWDLIFGTFRTHTHDPLESLPVGLAEIRDERAYKPGWLLRSPALRLPA